MMDVINQLSIGTVLIGLVTYVGYQLRSLPTLIWEQIRKRFVYSIHIEQGSELFSYFELWLLKHHEKSFKNVKASLNSDVQLVPQPEGEEDEKKLHLEHFSDVFIIQYKGKRLLIQKSREKFENSSDIKNAFHSNFKIEGWFAKLIVLDLLEEVVQYNKTIKKVKQTVYTNTFYGEWTNFGDVRGKDIDGVFLRQKLQIVQDISDFSTKESWYIKRGLLYKRGYLFYGPPGNGKTSLSLALAKHFKKDVYFLNLNDLSKDSDLFYLFSKIKNGSILVLEDVDVLSSTREGSKKVSFSALLNCMDGVFSKYGIITIMTTNHIEKIDKALIREGRIDVKYLIDNPDKETVEEYLTQFYEVTVKLPLSFKNVHSMSKIQEFCLQNKTDVAKAIENITKKSTNVRNRKKVPIKKRPKS